ncbi:MAG: hypothetical protein KatS3mg047_1492 [Bellilinea sp.]|nr:MAG: hypothetical protein KatS3mg047_1492 [Bellilinea sp.]
MHGGLRAVACPVADGLCAVQDLLRRQVLELADHAPFVLAGLWAVWHGWKPCWLFGLVTLVMFLSLLERRYRRSGREDSGCYGGVHARRFPAGAGASAAGRSGIVAASRERCPLSGGARVCGRCVSIHSNSNHFGRLSHVRENQTVLAEP